MSATESQVFKNGELRPNHPGKPLVFISVFFTIALLSVPLFSQEAEPELPPEEQTVFLIRPLTAKQTADIQDRLTETTLGEDAKSKMRIYSGSQQLKVLQEGLKGWENLKNKK